MSAAGDDPLVSLRALREDYARGLPQKVVDLRQAIADAMSPEAPTEALARARSLAHRLRGTAGSYGFAEVSAAAGDLEDALDRPADARAAAAAAAEALVAERAERAYRDFAADDDPGDRR